MSAALDPPAPAIDTLEIRPMAAIAELRACENLQRLAWGFERDLDVVPLTQMVAAAKAGGILLGAFDGGGELVGFCYGFRGRDENGDIHYSHMTAVDPAIKAAGLGTRLKWAQRKAALEQGLDRMVWTYDPLESLNAYFNFSKLGVLVDRYWENLYGETGSALHRGTPTDRFRAEWWLRSRRVERRARGRQGEVALDLAAEPDRYPLVLGAAAPDDTAGPGDPRQGLDEPRLVVQIPTSIQRIKQGDPEAALAWRMATRAVFVHYLERGWRVRECVRTAETPVRSLYLLERQ